MPALPPLSLATVHRWGWHACTLSAALLVVACSNTPAPNNPRSLDGTVHCSEQAFYPRSAQRLGLQAKVLINFWVQADGSVTNAAIKESARDSLHSTLSDLPALPEETLTRAADTFNTSALTFIQSCRFPPAPGFDPVQTARPVRFQLPDALPAGPAGTPAP